MRKTATRLTLALMGSAAGAACPALAEPAAPTAVPAGPTCSGGACSVSLKPDMLLAAAEARVAARDWAGARLLVDMLALSPELRLQSRFLKGYIATETGDLATAEAQFRAILADDPKQTRVRLELARLLLLRGREAAADYHFRLAAQDPGLPPEIARTVRTARSVLRDRRPWRFSFDVGIAPDSNINNATAVQTVDVNLGPVQVPLTLDEDARAKTGIGVTAGYSAGLRLPVAKDVRLLLESDGRWTNYDGGQFDDIDLQIAAGPEWRPTERLALTGQALVQQRVYGGRVVARDAGGRIGAQFTLSDRDRIGAEIDLRRTHSPVSDDYSGGLYGGNIVYERVVARSMIINASAYARRADLNAPSLSNSSFGLSLGIGGELPLGINAGISASAGRARFDEPQYFFSDERREDWRLGARANVGLRSVRVLGFSPAAEYGFQRNASNYDFYDSTRHRVMLKLARYF